VPALEIPFYDSNAYLRGSLHHVFYAGKNISGFTETKPILADNSMYVADSAYIDSGDSFVGGLYFYLGNLNEPCSRKSNIQEACYRILALV
jgi:hypothetical protein